MNQLSVPPSLERTYTELMPLVDEAREHRAKLQELGAVPGEMVRVPVPGPQVLYTLDTTLSTSRTFKMNGAANAAYCAQQELGEDLEHVIAASAGNWGLSLAHVATRLGLDCTVFVPDTIVEEKEEALRAAQATVVKRPSLANATHAAQEASKVDGAKFLHPYDNPCGIAGQALVFDDIIEGLQKNDVDIEHDPVTLLVQVGGGSLLTGIATAVMQAKQRKLINPNFSVCAVQPEDCNQALRIAAAIRLQQARIPVEEINLTYDGLAVANPSARAVSYCTSKAFVQSSQLVTMADCGIATQQLYVALGKRIEPAGVVSTAAFARIADRVTRVGKRRHTFVSIATGANGSRKAWEHVTDAPRRAQQRLLNSFSTQMPKTQPSTGNSLYVWRGQQNI